MSPIPKHLLVSLIAFAVIGLAGGGAWFWTSGELDKAVAEHASVSQQIQAVQSKGFFPSSQNLKLIETNQAEVTTLATDLLVQLDRAAQQFAPFLAADQKGLPPDSWKEKLVGVREELKKAADQHKIETAEDFYFGFKRYRVASPQAGATRDIGIQLAAIQQLSQLLIKARVSDIREVRRVMVEDAGLPGAAGGVAEEALTAAVVEGSGGLYRVYPFEIKFRCKPAALNQFMNELARNPMIFLTRFVVVENEKMTVPRRSEFAAPTASPEGGEAKWLVPIVGQEQIVVRMRIDLIFWNTAQPEKPPVAAPKATPAKP